MAAGSHNFYMEQGATFQHQLTWQDAALDPINVTGYTAQMQLRTTEEAADPPALTLTTENNRITLGGAAGTITLLVTAADTALLAAGSYVYDLELISGAGFVTRLIEGAVTVDREVTR
jgi:hypothetical protein